ncbi:P63C domain-containing protein [Chitinophaga sp. 22536]|uniref:P63C domain-containing protein n=1 Tax=unclassified Chitinophaga TaxID=2619133 RepID=UPI003F84A1AC
MGKKMLKAKYGAADRPLKIGDIEIPCYVLEDGKRVIVQRGLFKALGVKQGGTSEKYKEFGGAARLVQFMDTNGLIKLIPNDIKALLKAPVVFEVNNTDHFGYEATVLQDIVRAISKAYLKGILHKRYNEVGVSAEIMDDAFAKVGIIALVDEATGYQKARGIDALQAFLDKFLSDGYAKWVKTFPDRFFEMIFKMKGWSWHYATVKKPSVVGKYINDLVYSRLGPEVLTELQRKNPITENGTRRVKHHQYLSASYGNPKLKEHLEGLMALGRASGYDWVSFLKLVQKAYPKYGSTMLLDFPGE